MRLLLVTLLLLSSSVHAQIKSWAPSIEMERQIFPSYILAQGEMEADKDTTIEGTIFDYEDSMALFSVDLETNKTTRVKIEVLASDVNEYSVYEKTLNKGSYYIYPKIAYKFDVLRKQFQPSPINIQFVLSANGTVLGRQTVTARVRAISDCVFSYNSDAGPANLGYLFSAYVNEENPNIEKITKSALDSKIVSQFVGYQLTQEDVTDQIFAIWYVLQHRGVKYSSMTGTSSDGTSSGLSSQRIRSFSDVMNTGQANCVDGSAFMASVFRAIDLKPVLIRIPGHCFLGVYTKEDRSSMMVLETTMIGFSDFRNKPMDDQASIDISRRQFDQAQDEALKKYNTYLTQFDTDEHPDCQMIDIELCRAVGIKPIGR